MLVSIRDSAVKSYDANLYVLIFPFWSCSSVCDTCCSMLGAWNMWTWEMRNHEHEGQSCAHIQMCVRPWLCQCAQHDSWVLRQPLYVSLQILSEPIEITKLHVNFELNNHSEISWKLRSIWHGGDLHAGEINGGCQNLNLTLPGLSSPPPPSPPSTPADQTANAGRTFSPEPSPQSEASSSTSAGHSHSAPNQTFN